jgi:hypothetical protein
MHENAIKVMGRNFTTQDTLMIKKKKQPKMFLLISNQISNQKMSEEHDSS